jgi:choline dehydrogenase-like flavoprotein
MQVILLVTSFSSSRISMMATPRASVRLPCKLEPPMADVSHPGFIQSTVGGGVRSSSATAYLSPVLSRSNLDVIIQTRAIKLLSTKSNSSKLGPKFTTVVLAQSPTGPTINVKARKEIILAGGAAGTPHLLLLSGIGPKSQLNSFGIKPVVQSDDVGMFSSILWL